MTVFCNFRGVVSPWYLVEIKNTFCPSSVFFLSPFLSEWHLLFRWAYVVALAAGNHHYHWLSSEWLIYLMVSYQLNVLIGFVVLFLRGSETLTYLILQKERANIYKDFVSCDPWFEAGVPDQQSRSKEWT